MDKIKIDDKTFELYLKQESILPEIERVANEIKRDFEGEDPIFICILNGAFMFASELLKMIGGNYEICFAKYASYHGVSSTGKLNEEIPPKISMEGRSVIIIEDLVDTGLTLSKILELYKRRGAKEIKIAVMLSKPNAPKVVDVKPDYVGLEIPNDFIVGHGLDYNGKGRLLSDIYVVTED